MLSRNRQHVGRRLRIDVSERQVTVVLLDRVGRDFASGDPAKQAVLDQLPSASRIRSQIRRPRLSSLGGAPSISANRRNNSFWSAVRSTGVHTCTRTCRSPRRPRLILGSPFPLSVTIVPACTPPLSSTAAAPPSALGTLNSPPRAA